MLVLGTTILIMQAVFMPVGMVYAETTMETGELEQVELPFAENYLEAEKESEPRFIFESNTVTGTVSETINVKFFSDQEVSEAYISLPSEAKISKDDLPKGLSVVPGSLPQEWVLRANQAQTTFSLEVTFEDPGEYEISVQDSIAIIKIVEEDNNEHSIDEVEITEPFDYEKFEAKNDFASVNNELDSGTVIVRTSSEFLNAMNNNHVRTIRLNNSFTVNGNMNNLTRSLTILGQGNTINFASSSITLGTAPARSFLTMEDITIIRTGNGTLISSSNTNSQNWAVNFSNVASGQGNTAGLVNAVNARVTFNSGTNRYTTSSSNVLITSRYLTIENKSQVIVNATSNIYVTRQNESEFIIKDGAKVTWYSTDTVIAMGGTRSRMSVSDEGTEVNISSNRNDSGSDSGVVYLGDGDRNFNISVRNQAKLKIHSTRTTALLIRSEASTFTVDNQSEFHIVTDSVSGNNAALRFRNDGGCTFNITNGSIVKIEKFGGDAPAVRMRSSNNSIIVNGGSEFYIYNAGSSESNNNSNNQGIEYSNGNDQLFELTGEDSRVEIIADFGTAVTMDGRGTISAGRNTIFIARGRTGGANRGIFNTGVSTINLTSPKYFDFRNTRPGGGNIYNVSSSSTFTAVQTSFAVWRNGDNLDRDPFRTWNPLDFVMTGSNFNNIRSTNRPNEFNTSASSLGSNGFTDYSRLSANNAAAVVDELRVPTTADKKIFGHVSIPEAKEYRSAWTGEVTVSVEVEKSDGIVRNFQSQTVGHEIGTNIYGERVGGGWFTVELDDFLEREDQVRVVAAHRGISNNGFPSRPDDIRVAPVDVFPIIPPNAAQFSSEKIGIDSNKLIGYTDEQDAEVTVTHNGEPLNTESVSVDQDGRFTIDLSDVTLATDDEIQVFLRDSEGSAVAAGVVNPPETNNTRGNINPATELTFHDGTFEPATTLLVGDVGPVSPVDPLDPEIEVDPENKPELPEDQGHLSIDFISSFNFDSQAISVHDQTYYAQPQRLLNEDGTVNESEERPNYVQISDRRAENERNGWTLAVTQKEQFKGEENQVLNGARLSLSNQQVITAQGGEAPGLQSIPCTLVPGNRRTLLHAQGSEGAGTWIYRFGDGDTAGESVALNVPRGANPEATTYSSTLIWELSAVPGN